MHSVVYFLQNQMKSTGVQVIFGIRHTLPQCSDSLESSVTQKWEQSITWIVSSEYGTHVATNAERVDVVLDIDILYPGPQST